MLITAKLPPLQSANYGKVPTAAKCTGKVIFDAMFTLRLCAH